MWIWWFFERLKIGFLPQLSAIWKFSDDRRSGMQCARLIGRQALWGAPPRWDYPIQFGLRTSETLGHAVLLTNVLRTDPEDDICFLLRGGRNGRRRREVVRDARRHRTVECQIVNGHNESLSHSGETGIRV